MGHHVHQRVLAGIVAAVSSAAVFATHAPPGSAVVVYSGTLQDEVSVTDAINSAGQDGYNYYCFNATSGRQLSFVASSTNGLVPNLILLSSVAGTGATYSTIASNTVSETSNSSSNRANLVFTPTTTGTYTLVVSTFLSQSGTFSVGGSGLAAAPGACAGPVTPPVAANVPVPATDLLTLGGMALALAGIGAFVSRRQRRR
jgi:hypothetical protein